MIFLPPLAELFGMVDELEWQVARSRTVMASVPAPDKLKQLVAEEIWEMEK